MEVGKVSHQLDHGHLDDSEREWLRASRRSAIPFGPFMLAGALLAVFAADPIASWYSSLFFPAV